MTKQRRASDMPAAFSCPHSSVLAASGLCARRAMCAISGRRLLYRLTNRPTSSAEITVPSPSPLSRWKKSSDSASEMSTSVTSNATLTEPKRLPLAAVSAPTSPSPGTSSTSGATSTLMPKPSTAQPSSSTSSSTAMFCGSSQPSRFMLTSMNQLNTMFTTICSS